MGDSRQIEASEPLILGQTPRPLRIEYPGAVYHVAARGNARLPIYEGDTDRAGFLDLLEEVVERFKWLC